jgi:predicted nucleic acid-binding protein
LFTLFWVLDHRVDILSYLFRFFTVYMPTVVRDEVLALDPCYPQRVYGYQEMFRLLDGQGSLLLRNPTQPMPQFHAGEAAALALTLETGWWLLLNEQRALTGARQRGVKVVTVPEFIVYLYEVSLLSYRSAQTKLDGIAANTGSRVMQAAQHTFLTLAHRRGER